jgi:hypothetical protein
MNAEVESTASITARTSSIRSSSVGTPPNGSDIPVPRLSNMTKRLNEAMRPKKRAGALVSHQFSRWETKPGTKTKSTGPSPNVAYAMLRSPLRA